MPLINKLSARILVVDDNEMNRDMLARRLERSGFSVDTADGGNAGLERALCGNYNLVLLDELLGAGVMPGDISLMNGLGTHRAQTDAELRQMLGDQIVDGYRCLQHDCNDDS